AAAVRVTASPVLVPVLSAAFATVSVVGGILLSLGSSIPISPYVTTISFLLYGVCRAAGAVRARRGWTSRPASPDRRAGPARPAAHDARGVPPRPGPAHDARPRQSWRPARGRRAGAPRMDVPAREPGPAGRPRLPRGARRPRRAAAARPAA